MITLNCHAQNNEVYSHPALASYKAYQVLDIPSYGTKEPSFKPVRVAVIDNGFKLTHKAIQPYIFTNSREIQGNSKDDDGNGYIDDVSGWDVADNDNYAGIPEGRENFFYHGTMTAGIITQVMQTCFNDQASSLVQIVPIKVLQDQAMKSNYELGYDGIAYAVKLGVDIIVCAWGGGKYDAVKYNSVFEEAKRKGILILGSAGNFYSEQCDPPSSIASVYVVAAVDSTLHKKENSNYGRKVDFVAQGEYVYAAHPAKDNAYGYHDGTSAAVALVSGCAAALKAISPKANTDDLMAALHNTASPVDSLNTRYAGKLGAGVPNLKLAIQYLNNKTSKDIFLNSARPKGDIFFEASTGRTTWWLKPYGGIRGIYFSTHGTFKDRKTPIQFYKGDSLLASHLPGNFPQKLFVPGNDIKVVYAGKKGKKGSGLSYKAEPFDSTTLYCKETRFFENPEGEISDGSGESEYTNNCSCKWQITVAPGKHVKIIFDQFNTQAKLDQVWLFDGTSTLQENVLGIFSGPDLPPIIISPTNQVLVWFVTDSNTSSQGWHLNYTITDEEPGILAPNNK